MGYVNPLRKLNPVIIDGVTCVRGRLERAAIKLCAKHPVILPSKHHVADLIIRDCHEREGHVGAGQHKAPFSSVAVDYFGPIKLRRSQVKRYGCVFTCLAIRAVHREIAHDLKTDSFIQAFLRFLSRRGPPIEVFSDNRTNFKGAESEIKTCFAEVESDHIDNCLRMLGIKWYFSPPHASHAGGVWERMTRSICRILRALLGSQFVDDKTLLTLMGEVKKV